MTDPAALQSFGHAIQRLLRREDLDYETAFRLFREVLTGEQPELHEGAFLAALAAKGENRDEIAAAWAAIMECDTTPWTGPLPECRAENSGTGMDSLKTFHVSSAAAIVAAACGVTVARHGARALTSACGTVDLLESVGVDVECPSALVEESVRRTGIGLFNGMSPAVHPGGLGRILSRIRFGSILNIAASLANPARPTHVVRGVWSAAMVDPVAGLLPALGVRRGLVVHGFDDRREGGMDELSVTGETRVREFGEGLPARSWRLRPEDAGLKTRRFEEIAALGGPEAEGGRFLRVLAGRGEEACVDFTCLNAGALLYAAQAAAGLPEGVARCRAAIEDGRARRKLREWVGTQSRHPEQALARLEEAERRSLLLA